MNKTLLERFVQKPENRRLFLQERSILEVTELIEERLREAGISRSQLAKMLGKTKGWVTQLLDGEANKTIRTVADVLAVLGYEFHAYSQPISIGKASSDTVSPQSAKTEAISVVYSPAPERWAKPLPEQWASPWYAVLSGATAKTVTRALQEA